MDWKRGLYKVGIVMYNMLCNVHKYCSLGVSVIACMQLMSMILDHSQLFLTFLIPEWVEVKVKTKFPDLWRL